MSSAEQMARGVGKPRSCVRYAHTEQRRKTRKKKEEEEEEEERKREREREKGRTWCVAAGRRGRRPTEKANFSVRLPCAEYQVHDVKETAARMQGGRDGGRDDAVLVNWSPSSRRINVQRSREKESPCE